MLHFLTVANYSWSEKREFIPLAALWAQRLRKFHPGACLWWAVAEAPQHPDISYIIKKYEIELFHITPTSHKKKLHHNLKWKLGALCQFPLPFVFVDLDALAMGDMTPLWANVPLPFSATSHQSIPGHTEKFSDFMNSGVVVVHDPKILNQRKLLEMLETKYAWNHAAIPISGADQALLHCYFEQEGYEWRHPFFDHSWNAWAGGASVSWEGGEWKAWDTIEDRDIKVLHYWCKAKPWEVGCPMYALAKRSMGYGFG